MSNEISKMLQMKKIFVMVAASVSTFAFALPASAGLYMGYTDEGHQLTLNWISRASNYRAGTGEMREFEYRIDKGTLSYNVRANVNYKSCANNRYFIYDFSRDRVVRRITATSPAANRMLDNVCDVLKNGN